MTIVERSASVVLPSDGERIWDGPIDTIVKVPDTMTHGLLSIGEMNLQPGFMVPPHRHADTDEWSYVVFGTVGARLGDEEISATAGSWILKQRGQLHTFWNAGPEPARIIELLTPGRFEHFFRSMAELAARDDLSDARLESLGEEYGTTIDMTWVEDLAARHGLEVTL